MAFNHRKARQRLWDAGVRECYRCGKPFDSLNGVTLEHVIPRSQGGTNAWNNLSLSHRSCNNNASSSPSRKARATGRPVRAPVGTVDMVPGGHLIAARPTHLGWDGRRIDRQATTQQSRKEATMFQGGW